MVPNHSAQLAAWRQDKHFDGTTKIGCGRYTDAAAKFLHDHVDPRWRLLKKPNHLGGANHWRHHAVDAIVYLSDTPGQSTAVDLVRSGESKDADFNWWGVDEPRYNPEDCLVPTGDDFVLPPHQCLLGCSMFWLLGAYRRFRHGEPGFQDKIDRNCDYFKTKFDGDFLRMMFAMKGKDRGNGDPWAFIGGDANWPDFEEMAAGAIDYVWGKFALAVTPTLVGEGANVPRRDDKLRLMETCARIFRPRLNWVPFAEIWNERWTTDGDEGTIREMARYLHDLVPQLPLALDSPIFAADADPNNQLPAEVTRFYGGSVATVCTPQWNRDEPNPRDLGPDSPAVLAGFEGRGPGATGPDVTDPLALAHDYIQEAIASQVYGAGRFNYRYHVYHSQPGAFGGYAAGYPSQNQYPDLWTVPNAEAIASALKSVRHGQLPDVTPGEPDMPLKSREQFYAEFQEINKFYADMMGLKRAGGMVIDTGGPDPVYGNPCIPADYQAMGAWGYDLMSGRTVEQVKHDICQSDEWKGKHPGETPPF
jgi:hypothetical protein